MRIVLQRVTSASVSVDGETIAAIGPGLLLLVGVAAGDVPGTARLLARKCAELGIFEDAGGRFDRSLLDISGEALVVSQFTLLADLRRGRLPSFAAAATPDTAEPLVEAFVQALRNAGVPTQTGRFGAMMDVELLNAGPVTIILDSDTFDQPRRGPAGNGG